MSASDYVLTSSMQARAIAQQGRDALIAMAKDHFRSAVTELYRGALEKARLGDNTALHQHKDSADEKIVQNCLDMAFDGWRKLSLAVTGLRQPAWNDALGLRTRDVLYSYVRGFSADVPNTRERYRAVKSGATDGIIDAAVNAAENRIPLEFALTVIDGGFQK